MGIGLSLTLLSTWTGTSQAFHDPATNGDTIGGFVTMFGSATDDDGPVMQVEVQIDVNGDYDFIDSIDIDKDTTVQLGTEQDIYGHLVRIGDPAHKWEDESAWYVVNVTNNSWTQELILMVNCTRATPGALAISASVSAAGDQFGTASEYI